jgi:hypothetical protein
MSCVLQGLTLISTKQRNEGFLPDASFLSFEGVIYELCPAGTHAYIYETENEGFLMPKLLYFEGVVL